MNGNQVVLTNNAAEVDYSEEIELKSKMSILHPHQKKINHSIDHQTISLRIQKALFLNLLFLTFLKTLV